MPKYLSNRVKRTTQDQLTSERYRYLGLNQTEPNLGDPKLIYDPLPVGPQYQLISVLGDGTPGSRYWIPTGGGLIPGSISIYDEGYLVGSSNSITQLNFVGTAVSAQAVPLGIAATITISPPGNNGELIFKYNNDFATSSNLIFNPNSGILTSTKGINVGLGGSYFTATSSGLVGIGTTNPTQELHLQGDLRLSGTVYDFYNNPGTSTQLLIKNSLGGVQWTDQGTITAGAGGTYQNVQYHNASGILGGAPNFVYNEITSRVGIGSTIPRYTLDVLGIFNVTGQSIFENIYSTGISTLGVINSTNLSSQNLNVTGITTLGNTGITNLTSQNINSTGITTLGVTTTTNLNSQNLKVSGITTLGVTSTTNLNAQNLKVSGITTVGFLTGTDAYYTGIVTANTFVGNFQGTNNDFTNINVTGIATIGTLKVSGLTTTRNLQVIGISTLGITTATSLNTQNLYVSGITTLNGAYINNVTISGNSITTPTGNLILNSTTGTTQIIDIAYIDDSTSSTTPTNGALVVKGGAGIGSDVNIGATLKVTGSTTLSKDLYVTGISTFRNGPVIVGSSNSTGTPGQIFQVSGISSGAYIGGNLGIGTTNPTQNVHIQGNLRLTNSLYDSNNQVGTASSVLVSTGVGVSWRSIAEAALQGIQGSQGLQGTQGLQGRQGTQGAQGTQGLQGPQGLQGSQGLQGYWGDQGVQGRQGTQGSQGLQGIQGAQGLQGTQGISNQGVQGLQGTQGTQGTQGRQGTQGIAGLNAGQGAQGAQGSQGTQGTQGRQGTQGIAGLNAGQGAQGTQGTQGLSGFFVGQGAQGTQGRQGTQGALSNFQGTQGTSVQGLQGSSGGGGGVSFYGIVNTTPFTILAADVNKTFAVDTSVARTINLPAGSGLTAGATIRIVDIGTGSLNSGNSATFNITITPNGANQIFGANSPFIINVNGSAVSFIWVSATYGWRILVI